MRDQQYGLGGLCYEQDPDSELRCRRRLNHRGDHYNWPLKVSWPNTGSRKTPAKAAS